MEKVEIDQKVNKGDSVFGLIHGVDPVYLVIKLDTNLNLEIVLFQNVETHEVKNEPSNISAE